MHEHLSVLMRPQLMHASCDAFFQALSDLGVYLDNAPVEDSPPLPRGCYRFIGTTLVLMRTP
jgi:hypothetical protein